MKWRYGLLTLVLLGSPALAQSPPTSAGPTDAVLFPNEMTGTTPAMMAGDGAMRAEGGPLTGNHKFANFIGFMSNPDQNIDPRAVTAIYPIFGNAWVSNNAPIPNGDFQLYGPALTVALSDRLAVGLNDGGYAVAQFSRNPDPRFAQAIAQLDPTGRFRNVEAGGDREGWLNLGGFFQYTLIENVEDQFLLTGGLRWTAPSGSHEVFQGHGPLVLAPYATFGKEFGEFHVLATGGYQFPAGPGQDVSHLFYSNVHFDRRVCGWLYPLVEFNWTYHTKEVDFGLPTRVGFIDFGNFESTGNIVTMAVGVNAVLVKERLEIGAVYTKVLASQHDFDANGLIVKMMLRF
jgi:hypothetical protein